MVGQSRRKFGGKSKSWPWQGKATMPRKKGKK